MRRLKKLLSASLALAVTVIAVSTVTKTFRLAKAEESGGISTTEYVVASDSESQAGFSAKTYVPDKFDTVDFYGGVGDIDPEEGDGFTTFAHAGMIVPLQGTNVQMTTQFKLLSKTATENGGDGIDGWVTYSFSSSPADISSDKSYPYHGGTTNGYFLHITNYSSSTAPNCVEVQFVKMQDGATENVVAPFFMDNALNVKLELSLEKQADNTYTLKFATVEGTELKKLESLSLNDSLFINENGQTFFSTAIYEAEGCDGNHWEHRGIAIYSVQAYTRDITADDIILSQTSYEYVEGEKYEPDVTVTLDEVTLIKDVDYLVEYTNNQAVGTATAEITFVGAYAGNLVEKNFMIIQAEEPEDSSSESSSEGNSSVTSQSDGTSTESGCGSSLAVGGVATAVACMGALLIGKKRER